MFLRLVRVAVLAGLAGAFLASLLQVAFVWPLLDLAEAHEAGHDHGEHASIARRLVLVALTNAVAAIGFALLLAVAYAVLARPDGSVTGWRRGLAFGFSGFFAFVLGPALVLPPLPPGVESGALLPRQLLWMLAAICTAGAILVAVRRHRLGLHPALARLASIALVLLPHMVAQWLGIGLADLSTLPPGLATRYGVTVVVAALPFWLLMGALVGQLMDRPRLDGVAAKGVLP